MGGGAWAWAWATHEDFTIYAEVARQLGDPVCSMQRQRQYHLHAQLAVHLQRMGKGGGGEGRAGMYMVLGHKRWEWHCCCCCYCVVLCLEVPTSLWWRVELGAGNVLFWKSFRLHGSPLPTCLFSFTTSCLKLPPAVIGTPCEASRGAPPTRALRVSCNQMIAVSGVGSSYIPVSKSTTSLSKHRPRGTCSGRAANAVIRDISDLLLILLL